MNERLTARYPRMPALPFGARLTLRLIAGVPILCLLIASLVYFAALGRLLRANLAPVAAAEATRQLHHDIRLGTVGLTPGALTLTRIAVSNRETWQASHGEAALTADRVTIHYSLHDLLFDSANAAHAIGDIVIDRPVALIERLPNHLYNFSDLLKPRQKKSGRPFDGQVFVNHGTLTLRDYVAPARVHERPAVNTLYGVNVAVNFHSERYVYFDGAGQGRSERISNVALRGDASRTMSGRFRVFAKVSDGDARYWSDYFKAFPQGRILNGRAKLDITIARLRSKPAPGLPLDLLGRVDFSNVSVALTDPRLSRVPLQRIAGTANFTGAVPSEGSVTIDGVGYAAGQPVNVHGTVYNFDLPQLAFIASSPSFDPTPLVRDLPRLKLPPGVLLSRGASVTAQITGASSAPVISAEGTLPRVTYRGNAATNVRARILFANNVLSLPQVQFALPGGGQGVVRATINTETRIPTVLLGGRVAHVNLAALNLSDTAGRPALPLTGYADAAFLTTQGVTKANEVLSTVANVFVSKPGVAHTQFRSLRGRIAWAPGQDVQIRRAILEDAHGGVAVVSGQVPATPQSSWNLNVDAAGANLGSLTTPYLKAPLAGLAYAQARIVGPLSTPQLSGKVQIYGGRFNHIGIDAVTGNIVAGRDRVMLDNVVLRRYPTEARVSGTVTQLMSRNPALSLRVALAQGDVQDFLSLAREIQPSEIKLPTLTGTAQGTFRISGRLQSPQIVGHTAVTDATIEAYRLNKVRADIAYRNGTLRIDDGLVLGENGASATGHGQYAVKTGALAAAVNGRDLNVDLFRQLFNPYADLDGVLDFSVTVAGSVKSPSGNVSVSGRDLAVDGQALSPLTVAGRFADGVFTKTGGPWTLAIQPPPNAIDGTPINPAPAPVNYVVDDLRLALPTPAHPNRPRSIRLAVHVPAESPEHLSHLIDTVRSSQFASNPTVQKALTAIDALPGPPDGTLSVPSLTVKGTLDEPQITGTLEARKITIDDDNGAGQAEIIASVTGGAKPTAQATVQITDLRAAGIPIQKIAAEGGFRDRVVTLRTLDAHNEEADLHATGRADLDGSLTASLDASNVPLALLNGLIPTAKDGVPHKLSGTLSALTIDASGLTRAPDLIGSINLNKPALEVGNPGSGSTHYALDSIRTGAVTLSGTEKTRILSVNDLAVYKGGRPVATLSGTLPLNFTNSATLLALAKSTPLHAELKIADLSVLTLLSPSLIDPARTGGALTASVDAGSDALHGRVDIVNASAGLTGFDTGLTKIGGILMLSGNRITVQGLTGQSTKGGSVSVVGGGTLTQANLRVRADRFTIDETGKQNFLAQTYNSGVHGLLDGLVTLGGPWLSPHVATLPGAPLVVSGASGTIPSVTPPTGRIASISIDRAGPATVSTERVLAALTQKVGDSFDTTAAQRDLTALRNLGYFRGGVKLSTERDPTGGIVVTYTVAESTVQTFDPQFDVNVALGGSKNETVAVRSSLLKAQARGDVHLGGTLIAPTMRAHLTVANGQFILPPSTLLKIIKPSDAGENIVDARYPVADATAGDQPGLETRVDLTAQANVSVSPELLAANASVASPGVAVDPTAAQLSEISRSPASSTLGTGSQTQRYKITAHISGLLNVPDRLNLDLTSSPPGLSHQDMLAALVQEDAYLRLVRGGGGAENAIKTQLGAAFSTFAIPTLLSPIEESIVNTFGLEDFSVDYTPESPVLVTLSKLIAPRITATYIRSFGARTPGTVNSVLSPPQYQLKLGYGFTKHFQFSISTDDQRNNTAALEGVYGF